MKGLLEPPPARDFPALTQWLAHAESTRRVVRDKYVCDEPHPDLLNVTIQENVLAQLENLRTHPVVASGLAQGKLKLHAWVYKFETGEVFGYEPASGQFQRLGVQPRVRTAPVRDFQSADV
jgi:carbonic anhydrase